MKSLLRIACLIGVACGVSACNRGVDFKDTAQVVSSTPAYREVNSLRQECWVEEIPMAPSVGEQASVQGSTFADEGEAVMGDEPEASGGSQELDLVPVPVAAERSGAAPLVGGVAGGMIGSHFGGGSGQALASGIGVIAGAIAGDRMANGDPNQTEYMLQEVPRTRNVKDRNQPHQAVPLQQQFCRTVEDRQLVPDGFTVVYRYNGRDITAHLPYDPGSTLTVGVRVMR